MDSKIFLLAVILSYSHQFVFCFTALRSAPANENTFPVYGDKYTTGAVTGNGIPLSSVGGNYSSKEKCFCDCHPKSSNDLGNGNVNTNWHSPTSPVYEEYKSEPRRNLGPWSPDNPAALKRFGAEEYSIPPQIAGESRLESPGLSNQRITDTIIPNTYGAGSNTYNQNAIQTPNINTYLTSNQENGMGVSNVGRTYTTSNDRETCYCTCSTNTSSDLGTNNPNGPKYYSNDTLGYTSPKSPSSPYGGTINDPNALRSNPLKENNLTSVQPTNPLGRYASESPTLYKEDTLKGSSPDKIQSLNNNNASVLSPLNLNEARENNANWGSSWNVVAPKVKKGSASSQWSSTASLSDNVHTLIPGFIKKKHRESKHWNSSMSHSNDLERPINGNSLEGKNLYNGSPSQYMGQINPNPINVGNSNLLRPESQLATNDQGSYNPNSIRTPNDNRPLYTNANYNENVQNTDTETPKTKNASKNDIKTKKNAEKPRKWFSMQGVGNWFSDKLNALRGNT